MNKNCLSKAFGVSGIVVGGTVLLVSLPLLITSHVKHKKEHPELKGTSLEIRDDLLVTCATGGLAVLATDIICDAIKNLKKK